MLIWYQYFFLCLLINWDRNWHVSCAYAWVNASWLGLNPIIFILIIYLPDDIIICSLYCHTKGMWLTAQGLDCSLDVCLTAGAGGWYNCDCWRWYWVSTQETWMCVCLEAPFYKPGSVINCGRGQVRFGQWWLCPLFVFFFNCLWTIFRFERERG